MPTVATPTEQPSWIKETLQELWGPGKKCMTLKWPIWESGQSPDNKDTDPDPAQAWSSPRPHHQHHLHWQMCLGQEAH